MHSGAAEVLARRVELSPKNPMIWNDLGVEYVSAGQHEAAAQAFSKAHQAFAEYPLPLYNLGRLAMELYAAHRSGLSELSRKFALEAIGYVHESVCRDPQFYHAHLLLAEAYDAVDDQPRASSHAKMASRLNPDEPIAQRALWLEKVPLLGKALVRTKHPPLPFVLSSGKHTHVADQL